MKNIYTTLSIVFVFISSILFAQQDIPFEKAYFKDRKDEFKEALDHYETGDSYFEQGPMAYKIALDHYLQAQKFNPNYSLLNYKIGKCYLYSIDKGKALDYLLKAQKLRPDVESDVNFLTGWAYQLKLEFDKAINEFRQQKLKASGKDGAEMLEKVNKHIEECEYGKKLVANPVRVFIDNLGSAINTKYPEYGPIINADNTLMLFTSRRPNTTGGAKDESLHEYYEDLYSSTYKNGSWTSAVNIGEPANSADHDATVALSPDGQKLLIYKDDKGDGNLYEILLTGDKWSKPVKLDKAINTKDHESSAAYSYDGKTLYFVSSRQDMGLGGRDIYVSNWDDEKGKWGEPKNLGPVINTKYNEESVFIHPDGKTMYFSSQGHQTMGGYDIFKTELKNGNWTKPENIGYPINTPDDDVFFVVNASGRYGYYSSFKEDGMGEKDIYKITFLGAEKPLALSGEDNLLASIAAPVKEKMIEKDISGMSKQITILKGTIREIGSNKPLEAEIELIDVEANKTLATFTSNSSTGKYLVSLPSGKNYGIAVKKTGYLFHSENFNIAASSGYNEVVIDVDLKKLEVGSRIILKNIFYDYNKSTLRNASMNELDRLKKLLDENPTLKIELSAHTDSRGGDAYNNKLSQERAQACVDYLTSKGIDKSRLIAKGYGESQLIMSDAEIAKLPTEEAKEEAHQQNRRTEFKIVAK